MSSKPTILLGLNEINFVFLKKYIALGRLPNFKRLFESSQIVETASENKYELLEPWIQWVTIYAGKSYDEHGIFRLGDIVNHPGLSQLFEELEASDKSVGAVSPFNAENRLKDAAFFVPDPWTKTEVSGGRLLKALYRAIHQAVNDNAQEKISLSTIFILGIALLRFVPLRHWLQYIKYFIHRKKPGVKSIILDSLLIDVFSSLRKKKRPDFSHLFLNSGAHIQHHYMFNSSVYDGELQNPEWYCPHDWDPLIEVFSLYDRLIGKLLEEDLQVFMATGLHQEPHSKNTYYWRLKDHSSFLKQIGINNYSSVEPRMSRDFLIVFKSEKEASMGQRVLESLVSSRDDEAIFSVDNRGQSLFVELVYSKEIQKSTSLASKDGKIKIDHFEDQVSFVAIKNGEHNGLGYFTSNLNHRLPPSIPLTEVKTILKDAILGQEAS